VNIFVSYARADNNNTQLRQIFDEFATLGETYVDDLVNHGPDRLSVVLNALAKAELFIVVHTTNYLRTTWTRREYFQALDHDLPMIRYAPAPASHAASCSTPDEYAELGTTR